MEATAAPTATEALDRIIAIAQQRNAEYVVVGVDAETETVVVGATIHTGCGADWHELAEIGTGYGDDRRDLLAAGDEMVRTLWRHCDLAGSDALTPDGILTIWLPR